ncbi:MAG: hypothetical protein R3E44_04710 [Paracoccaceae bacterium]
MAGSSWDDAGMNGGRTRYLLVCNTSDGLVAQLNGVVVQLQLARRMGLEPIVHLHGRSYLFGGPNPYFDDAQGPNVWDYYYEPIGPSLDDVQSLIREGRVYTLSTASELVRLYRWEPKSWFMNPYGYFRSVKNRADGDYPADWWQAERDKARVFLHDGTLRFRPSILAQVEAFIAQNFSEETLGLQLRGSDKFDFGVGPNLSRKVLPEEYFPHIDRYLAEHPKCTRIFVATDQRQWLKDMETAYPGKVISYSEISLSDTDENRFHDAQAKAARGVEVLVDLLLLSRCDHVIKCHAAVGEMALVLNPKAPFLDLNYARQPMQARRRALGYAVAPVISVLCALWRVLAERGMALERVTAVDGDEIIVGNTPGRSLNIKTGADEKAPRPPFWSRRFVSDGFDFALRALAERCFRYEPRDGTR